MVRQVNLWHFCKSTHSFEGTHYKWQHYRPAKTDMSESAKNIYINISDDTKSDLRNMLC